MDLKKANIGIIGMGYVGLPLAVEFSKKLNVIGFDINKKRVNQLKKGIDFTNEVSKKEIINSKKISFSGNILDLKKCQIYIITVPTPINKKKKPNLTAIVRATEKVSKVINKNDLVIYESTVYPGVTEEICGPILEKKTGLKINQNLFLGYSPERINPGDKKKRLKDIVKITSGSNLKISKFISDLYSLIIKAGIHKAKSIKVAEAAKVIENTQRDLNIAFINELSLIFKKMKIPTEDVLKAAETKWNFMPYRPGLVGGHCIGVDPYYLTFKSKQIGYDPKLILSGRNLNDQMHRYIFKEIKQKNKIEKIITPKVLIMGLTFKENCPDTRNSKILDLYNLFKKNKFSVFSHDPYSKLWNKSFLKKFNFLKKLENKKFDVVVLAVKHKEFIESKDNIQKLCSKNGFIYDVKYVLSEKIDSYRL